MKALRQEDNREIRDQLSTIHHEILTITGNGNRGRIDMLGDRLSSVEGGFTALVDQVKNLEKRLWSVAIKIDGVLAGLAVLTELAMKHFGI